MNRRQTFVRVLDAVTISVFPILVVARRADRVSLRVWICNPAAQYTGAEAGALYLTPSSITQSSSSVGGYPLMHYLGTAAVDPAVLKWMQVIPFEVTVERNGRALVEDQWSLGGLSGHDGATIQLMIEEVFEADDPVEPR